VNNKYPEHIIRVETFDDKFIKYTPQDFANAVDRIKEQVDAVSAFSAACREARFTEVGPEQSAQAQ
jgi:hypothetical protein